jgi:hypothetical protein
MECPWRELENSKGSRAQGRHSDSRRIPLADPCPQENWHTLPSYVCKLVAVLYECRGHIRFSWRRLVYIDGSPPEVATSFQAPVMIDWYVGDLCCRVNKQINTECSDSKAPRGSDTKYYEKSSTCFNITMPLVSTSNFTGANHRGISCDVIHVPWSA